MVTYNTRNILTYKIPDFSCLSAGVNHTNATPMRIRSGLERFDETSWSLITYMASETIHDPLSAREFDLYYARRGIDSRVVTLTIPIDISDDEVPIPRIRSAIIPKNVGGSDALSFYKDLYFDKAYKDDGVYYLVVPLKSLVLQGLSKALRMFMPCEEFEQISQAHEVEMDEATGRVIAWGWNYETQEAEVFVGDLV